MDCSYFVLIDSVCSFCTCQHTVADHGHDHKSHDEEHAHSHGHKKEPDGHKKEHHDHDHSHEHKKEHGEQEMLLHIESLMMIIVFWNLTFCILFRNNHFKITMLTSIMIIMSILMVTAKSALVRFVELILV